METRHGAIDIHKHDKKLRRELDSLMSDSRILPANRERLASYIRLRQQGLVGRRRQLTAVSPARCRKLLTILKRFALELDAPFLDITADQLEAFIVGLEDGTVTSISPNDPHRPYSPETRQDFCKIIRMFYKHELYDQPERAEELVGWIQSTKPTTKPRALDPAVIPTLARAIESAQGAALIWTFFDTGGRISEIKNVRLQDLRLEPQARGPPVVVIEITVSKTYGRSIAIPLAGDAVRFWIERHPQGGPFNELGVVEAKDPDALLFTWSYDFIRKKLRALGERELGQHLHPHMFRHTSATFWATRLPPYLLNARMGWSMSSQQANRYVSRRGFIDREASRHAVSAVAGAIEPGAVAANPSGERPGPADPFCQPLR